MNKYKTLFKFALLGMVSTAIDYIFYVCFIQNNVDVYVAKIVSMSVAMCFSYFVNKKWSFNSKTSINRKEIFRYLVTQVINITVNTLTNSAVYIITNEINTAFVIATGFATIINYLLQKKWVFKETV